MILFVPITFRGGNHADLLNGGEGNDWIDGGWHTDTCIGGGGSDTFISCELVDPVGDPDPEDTGGGLNCDEKKAGHPKCPQAS